MASPGALNPDAMLLLSRLVVSLHRLHADHGWDIAGTALLRAKSMADKLKSMNEHQPLVDALLGADTSLNIPPYAALPVDGGQAMGGAGSPMVWDWNGMNFDFGPFAGLLPT